MTARSKAPRCSNAVEGAALLQSDYRPWVCGHGFAAMGSRPWVRGGQARHFSPMMPRVEERERLRGRAACRAFEKVFERDDASAVAIEPLPVAGDTRPQFCPPCRIL